MTHKKLRQCGTQVVDKLEKLLVTYSCPKEKMRCVSQVTVVEFNANATLFHKLSLYAAAQASIMHMPSREGWRGREWAGSAGGRRARVASGGACGQKYFWGVRAYAGARGENIFLIF